MRSIRLAASLCAILVVSAAPRGECQGTGIYLSDAHEELALDCRQGWGVLGLDIAARASDNHPPKPLQIGDTVYEKGLGHHADGAITYRLDGRYTAFAADLGVHRQGGARGSVAFRVFVDGELRFESQVLSDDHPAIPIEVPLDGAQELRLVADSAGDGISCDMANWANARLILDPNVVRVGPATATLCGRPAPVPSSSVCGFSLVAAETGPQIALLDPADSFVVAVSEGEYAAISIPVTNLPASSRLLVEATLIGGHEAEVVADIGDGSPSSRIVRGGTVRLEMIPGGGAKDITVTLETRGRIGESTVRWSGIRLVSENDAIELPVKLDAGPDGPGPAPVFPTLRKPIEDLLIEWDWRMQDGIGVARAPRTYAEAIAQNLERGDLLIEDLQADGLPLQVESALWQELRRTCESLPVGDPRWEQLWRDLHALRRQIVLANPLAQIGPLLFVKQAPGCFSHQLTQYYGRYAKPGGGLFVLDRPGASMESRRLAPERLAEGSYMQPEVCYDGNRILFAFCEAPACPEDTIQGHHGRYYHLYEADADGTAVRQLTDGPFDDFSPRELPNGRIVFVSTRRGGWHRCGTPGCEVYTLALAEADGSNPHPISYHETQEWDPAVLADGRIVYTRWDYVDRNAVFYEQLWAVRPDGTNPAAYYGNNTFNPVGVWEPRQVPGADLVMATAAAHHAMTAGSIILVDVTKGVDGLEPLTRLTPDAPFPESETTVLPRGWHAVEIPEPPAPPEAVRWPGHCYRSPYPLSEKYFLAAYSFDSLIGEPDANPANMFGVYLVDSFGNKELLYRDLNISSLWPVPLRPRPRPPVVPSVLDPDASRHGTFLVQNLYESVPVLPNDSIKRLRVVQVLPKSTPGANRPTVGLANASPGKQVLGTVPVETDGSAYFRVPAGIPLAFQILDEHGRAVQIMRSLTYLQPGEFASCVGCHEHRLTAPSPQSSMPLALNRPPSDLEPGPDGSNPLSYPLLVQPVLEEHCVSCHGDDDPAGPEGHPVVLTGVPEGRYTASYNALAPRVPYSSWEGGPFREKNCEPLTKPGHFGARGSTLMAMLLEDHHDVELSRDDTDRLVTWMDANALFYGTFDPADQARQQRGERIAGPGLE